MNKIVDAFHHCFFAGNKEIPDKEYIVQKNKKGYRGISWHPHYIMTEWFKVEIDAIQRADKLIEKYYGNIAP